MAAVQEAHKRTCILVADENAFNRNIVTEILRGAGLDNLLFARDGDEMLQSTVQWAPQIVIANSRLPKLSGLEFTRKIRAGHQNVDRALSIIVATSTATANFLEAARASGVDEMLVRPFTAAALLARIEAVLLRPRRFIDSISYVGPCRRRRMLEEYGGPMRRFCDPFEAPGDALWEAETNRELVRQCVNKLHGRAEGLAPGDRRKLHEIYQAVQDTEQLADDVRDELLGDAARSLSQYITAIGASRALDPEVISTHIDALQKLSVLTLADQDERQSLVYGLGAIVDKRLGRKQAAA